MPQYVVYEIWTRVRTVTARNEHEAYGKGEPEPYPTADLTLSNWHVAEVATRRGQQKKEK